MYHCTIVPLYLTVVVDPVYSITGHREAATSFDGAVSAGDA